jgi:hypothetical protein
MLTRRSTFSLLGALALAPSAALAQAPVQFRGINVDVNPLRTDMGDDTANWVAQALPTALAQVLGPYMQPGNRNAALLTARIDFVYLGPNSGPGPLASSQDTIGGTLIVHGGRGTMPTEIPLRAITSYYPTGVDQALWVESNRARIVLLSKTFAGWAPRELGL